MNDDNDKGAIAYFNVHLADGHGRGITWGTPGHLDYVYIANGVVHGVEVKDIPHIAGSQLLPIIDADHAAGVQEAFDRGLIKGNISVMYLDHMANRAVLAARHHGSKRPVLESCAEVAAYEEALARRLAMPPGLWMSRIARGVFLFSPKTVERVFEEIIADYRHEMIEAEVAGRTADLRWLRIQYWGAFIKSLITELAAGSLGRIIKALTGG